MLFDHLVNGVLSLMLRFVLSNYYIKDQSVITLLALKESAIVFSLNVFS